MKWYIRFILLVAAVYNSNAETPTSTTEKSSQKPAGVVYLIGLISQNKDPEVVDDGVSNAIPGATNSRPVVDPFLLNPIPIDEAGDGIYFRPENGKPLKEPQRLRVPPPKNFYVRERRSIYHSKSGVFLEGEQAFDSGRNGDFEGAERLKGTEKVILA